MRCVGMCGRATRDAADVVMEFDGKVRDCRVFLEIQEGMDWEEEVCRSDELQL